MHVPENQGAGKGTALIRVATIFILFDGMAVTDPASAMSGEHGRAAGAMVSVVTTDDWNGENTTSVAAHRRKEDLVVQAPGASHDPVHAAARAEHWGCGRPTPRLRVVNFVHRRHERRQPV